MANKSDYIPITTDDAVKAVLSGAWLFRTEIPDLRALIEGVQSQAEQRDLDLDKIEIGCIGCRIIKCQCRDLEIRVPLNFAGVDTLHEPPSTVFDEAEFRHAMFTRDVDFQQVMFTQNAYFIKVTFTAHADFRYATFTQEAGFAEPLFTEGAYFSGATFTKNAYFSGATFRKSAEFLHTTFTQDASFFGATFTKNTYFYSAKLSGRLGLVQSAFTPDASLNFHEIDLRPGGRIELSIEQIGRRGKRLIMGEDSKGKDDLASAAAQYNMLRDNFRALPSRDEEEDRCHYKYMDLKRRSSKSPEVKSLWDRPAWAWHWLQRFIDWALFKWCYGYGIYTKRIVLTMLGVIFACGVVYRFSAGPETIRHYCVTRNSSLNSGTQPIDANCETAFSPLYFSVITFTTIGYGDYAPRGWLRWVAGLEGLLGLFLMAVFTVSFARKFIR